MSKSQNPQVSQDKREDEEIQGLKSAFEDRWISFYSSFYSNQDSLHEAVKYSLDGEGKRVRPMMTLLSHIGLNGKSDDSFLAAIAVEMIHTYSLIHDDLPCMDDDDLRRGKPTVHKEFGEAPALLAGDALLTDAFGVLAQFKNRLAVKEAITELSTAAGSHGMVLGQSLDLSWTNKEGHSIEILGDIHTNKTGKLMGAACALGALTAGADEKSIARLRAFGQTTGLVFQIIDDLIDPIGGHGKTTGKDEAQNKLTFLKFYSADEAMKKAEELMDSALGLLDAPGIDCALLKHYTKQLLSRKK